MTDPGYKLRQAGYFNVGPNLTEPFCDYIARRRDADAASARARADDRLRLERDIRNAFYDVQDEIALIVRNGRRGCARAVVRHIAKADALLIAAEQKIAALRVAG